MGNNPLYRVRASGMGGSGYARPPVPGESFRIINNADKQPIQAATDEDGNAIIVPGVTTVNKSMGDGPGLVQWKIDQTAAYAVANVDALLNRTEEQGYGFLRWYHKRVPDLSDPLRSAHSGVLNDLAELGTSIHDYVEADTTGLFLPEIDTVQLEQMADAWLEWKFSHNIEQVHTELTVYGDGYAGTLDGIWWIDGELVLIDVKSSRSLGDGHKMQLGALRKATRFFVRDGEGWVEKPMPEVDGYGFIQIRPDDDDKPRFAEYHRVDEEELDLYYSKFMHHLGNLQDDLALKKLRKARDGVSIETNKEEV